MWSMKTRTLTNAEFLSGLTKPLTNAELGKRIRTGKATAEERAEYERRMALPIAPEKVHRTVWSLPVARRMRKS